MIDTFSKEQFEASLPAGHWQSVGLKQGEYAYLINTNNEAVKIEVRSSVDRSGFSADCGEDSIRAWLVDESGNPIGGKTQRWVTRVPGWADRLLEMLRKLARLAAKVRHCPICGELLVLARGKGNNKDKFYIFCPQDARERNNPNWKRHYPFTVVDPDTGHVQQQEEKKRCPVCDGELICVEIRKGKNKGKKAFTCPAKDENGNYMNHCFLVQE